jgi:hypothetical protein
MSPPAGISAGDVLALAPDEAAARAARATAVPSSWSAAGRDAAGAWGRYIATAAEPYEVAVDLRDPAFRCSCPSRKVPCKHTLGLLLLVAAGEVPEARRLGFAHRWLMERAERAASAAPRRAARTDRDGPVAGPPAHAEAAPGGADGAQTPARRRIGEGSGGGTGPPNRRAMERAARVRAGLEELDRWLADRVRAGLAAPELAEPATWQRAVARLVDAQCGGLANRVLRVAGRVGTDERWHDQVLAELAVLHVLASAGGRAGELELALADAVRGAVGYTVARDDVLAGVPVTDCWHVCGRSETEENRVVVRRTWLRGAHSLAWALVLSFAAFGESLTDDLPSGTVLDADLHWYPARLRLRALVGTMYSDPRADPHGPPPGSIESSLAEAGRMIAAEPWLERAPLCVTGCAAPVAGGRWVLTDDTGSLPLALGFRRVPELAALTATDPVVVAGEWSADGFLPLTAWAEGRLVVL